MSCLKSTFHFLVIGSLIFQQRAEAFNGFSPFHTNYYLPWYAHLPSCSTDFLILIFYTDKNKCNNRNLISEFLDISVNTSFVQSSIITELTWYQRAGGTSFNKQIGAVREDERSRPSRSSTNSLKYNSAISLPCICRLWSIKQTDAGYYSYCFSWKSFPKQHLITNYDRVINEQLTNIST